jgi:hypothetical protein
MCVGVQFLCNFQFWMVSFFFGCNYIMYGFDVNVETIIF